MIVPASGALWGFLPSSCHGTPSMSRLAHLAHERGDLGFALGGEGEVAVDLLLEDRGIFPHQDVVAALETDRELDDLTALRPRRVGVAQLTCSNNWR